MRSRKNQFSIDRPFAHYCRVQPKYIKRFHIDSYTTKKYNRFFQLYVIVKRSGFEISEYVKDYNDS